MIAVNKLYILYILILIMIKEVGSLNESRFDKATPQSPTAKNTALNKTWLSSLPQKNKHSKNIFFSKHQPI